MSKSQGNGVEPEKVANNLGADILRLWIASTDYRYEMTYSDEVLKRTADAYRRIRNTARFLLANLAGFDPDKHMVSNDELLALDAWAVGRAAALQAELIPAYDKYEFHVIYQKLHNFCSVDMGSFYLDIIKDRQYTTQEDSVARRSAQTALYHIVEALSRWLAPIISFTAEEIWGHIPGKREDSVFLQQWYSLPELSLGKMDLAYWAEVMEIRTLVNRELERLRNEGEIGANLQAEVSLYCNENSQEHLAMLKDELRFVTITSTADVHPYAEKPDSATEYTLSSGSELAIAVKASKHQKCARCWHYREDVGHSDEHPELCGRCIDNVTGEGETRHYA
jgi:isoleucyl-tRNA synthetase